MLTCSCHRIMLQLYMSADHSFHLEGLFHIIHAGTHFAFPLFPPMHPLLLLLLLLLNTLSFALSPPPLAFCLPSRTCRCPIPISPITPCSRSCMRLPTPAANQGCPYITVASQGRPCITAANHRSPLASRSRSLSSLGRTVTRTAIWTLTPPQMGRWVREPRICLNPPWM